MGPITDKMIIYPSGASGPYNSRFAEIINTELAAAKDPIIIKAPEYAPLKLFPVFISALSIRALIIAKGNTIVPTVLQKQSEIIKIPTIKTTSLGIGTSKIEIDMKEKIEKIRHIERVSFKPYFSESFFHPIKDIAANTITIIAINMNSFPLMEITNVDKFRTKY